MNFFLCVCLAAILAGVQALTDEQRAKMDKFSKPCKVETGVSQEVIDKAREGDFTDDIKLKKQILCVMKNAGLAEESGEILVDVYRQKLKKITDSDEELDRILNKCFQKKDSKEETAFAATKCLQASVPSFAPLD